MFFVRILYRYKVISKFKLIVWLNFIKTLPEDIQLSRICCRKHSCRDMDSRPGKPSRKDRHSHILHGLSNMSDGNRRHRQNTPDSILRVSDRKFRNTLPSQRLNHKLCSHCLPLCSLSTKRESF